MKPINIAMSVAFAVVWTVTELALLYRWITSDDPLIVLGFGALWLLLLGVGFGTAHGRNEYG